MGYMVAVSLYPIRGPPARGITLFVHACVKCKGERFGAPLPMRRVSRWSVHLRPLQPDRDAADTSVRFDSYTLRSTSYHALIASFKVWRIQVERSTPAAFAAL